MHPVDVRLKSINVVYDNVVIYDISGLQTYINRVQRNYITLANVIDVFVDAVTFGVQTIQYSCLAMLGKDLKKILEE